MALPRERRLYAAVQVQELLNLTCDQVNRLVNTGQLRALRLCGEIRFDSYDVDGLIETYKQVADRKKNARVISQHRGA
jgi:hypothetical protein